MKRTYVLPSGVKVVIKGRTPVVCLYAVTKTDTKYVDSFYNWEEAHAAGDKLVQRGLAPADLVGWTSVNARV